MMSSATEPAAARPSWWAYAAKAVTALAVCLLAALGVLLAALNDGHVSTAEKIQIAIAFFNAFVTPLGVYRVSNNYAGRRVGGG
jgi:hypothetical protein